VTLIIGIPLYGCIQAIWTPLYFKTALFTVAYYFATGVVRFSVEKQISWACS
jgi:stearoyl-CoA desaturase (Delta-9 desaturase)